ncbi:MAG TPA: hypothetical protein V6C52_11715, partial [Coleofasciculaceae cyanobacterium]
CQASSINASEEVSLMGSLVGKSCIHFYLLFTSGFRVLLGRVIDPSTINSDRSLQFLIIPFRFSGTLTMTD